MNRVISLSVIGEYALLMKRVFAKPQRIKMLGESVSGLILSYGYGSLYIVFIISIFSGAILTLQMAYNLEMPLLPKYLISYANRESLLLEFSSTVICLILAGKVGSRITSELGSMKVTEQIDALEVMGVNSAQFLILPKIIGFMLVGPVIYLFSVTVGIIGGFLVAILTDVVAVADYIEGVFYSFNPFYVTYSIIKMFVFTFIIASIASFFGYNMKGGALDVGRASTRSVETCSVVLLVFDLILTQLLLT